jgi:hypothetical protein
MLKKILGAAVRNVKRFFGVWLVILIANQLFIFGACFAPHCLAAALPHTLVIALLINLFGFRQDQSASHPASAPGGSSETTTADVETTSRSSHPGQPEQVKHRTRHLALLALIPIGVIGAVLLAPSDSSWKSDSTSIAAFETAGDEVPNTEVPDERALPEELYINDTASRAMEAEVPDERAPPEELLAEDRPYYARQAEVPDHRISHLVEGYDDDEFDVNDIETYERLTKKKYRGATVYNKDQLYVVEDVPDMNDVGSGEDSAKTKASKIGNKPEQRASTQQAYQCSNSAGKVGVGTGRLSQASKYSSFLKREVRAGEFVIFKYLGSGKEYWFRVSSCALL